MAEFQTYTVQAKVISLSASSLFKGNDTANQNLQITNAIAMRWPLFPSLYMSLVLFFLPSDTKNFCFYFNIQ